MLTRIFLGLVCILGFSGCAATQTRTQTDQLQGRITELEKKLEEKDSEIVDLQYEVKDLSSKMDTGGSSVSASQDSERDSGPITITGSGSDLIKVNTTVEKVQTALKRADFYNGKVDGKLGPATKSAIIEFQRSKGLTADGVVGRRTWDSLKVYLN